MKQNVWILNHYASDTFFDHGGRHYYFAKYLKLSGYDPTVFCCNSVHGKPELYFNTEQLWEIHEAKEIHVPYVFVRGRAYTGNGKQRIFNMLDFYRNVKKAALEYAVEYGKPDVIYASSVHPLTLVAGLQLAKYFNVKCICEVRDLWPETFVALKVAGPYNPVVVGLRQLEKWIYKEADALIFTLAGGYDYIKERHWEHAIKEDKCFYINNGVDLDEYDYNRDHEICKDPDLNDPSTFKVVYTGSVRPANGMDMLVDCARQLKDHSDIRFLIYGTGESMKELQVQCAEEHIDNLIFKGQIPKKQVPYVLSKGDLNVLTCTSNHASILRFGSSQNKLFEYLASGKPILCNVAIAYSPIRQENCGISENLLNAKDYAAAVLQIYNLSKTEYDAMCFRTRQSVAEYDFKNLSEKLIGIIEGV